MKKLPFILFFIIVVFGLVMLSSASVVESQKNCGSAYCYVWHQILYGFLPGLILFLIGSRIPYKKWRVMALPILLIAMLLLLLVFIPGIGRNIKGADRWLDLRIATVQPAEFLKFALILYFAAWFSNRDKKQTSAFELIPFFLVLGIVGGLLVKQPDFGTLGIVLCIGVSMYFFSGARLWHFAILIGVFSLMLVMLSIIAPYRFDRIKTFLHPEADKQGSGYHINQALISIGSGGIFGLGYGQSKQKFNYLPEPVGDSIFAVIVEELGFVGGAALVILFVFFLFSLLRLAQHTHDQFARTFILGVAVWIGGQAFINIAAITGMMPLTGVPLPLISYGSSSLVSIMTAMGIVRNIARS